MTTPTAERDSERVEHREPSRDPQRERKCETASASECEPRESQVSDSFARENRDTPPRETARDGASERVRIPDLGDAAMFAPQPRHAALSARANVAPIAPARAADEVPAIVAWLGVIGVALPSLLALAWFQHRLYLIAAPGLPEPLAWGLAIGLDWGSIVAGVFWLRGSGELRTWGRAATVALVGGSTALMCWSWWLLSGPGWAALGLIPAAVVFAMTKLLTLWQGQRARNRTVLADAAAQVASAQAAQADAEARTEQVAADAAAERAELVARLDALEASGPVQVSSAAEGSTEDTGPLPVTPPQRGRVAHIQDRAGGSKKERARAFVLAHVDEHGSAPTGAEVDAHVGGKSTGRAVLAEMRRSGELDELTAASA